MAMRIPPGLVALAGGVAIWSIARYVPASRVVVPGSRVMAIVLGGIGVALTLLGVASFLRARTSVDPLHPEKASTLVVTGIYRFTRNPMYLGFALMLLALAVRLSVWPGGLVVAVFVVYMNRFQIRPEENALDAQFGDAARAYRRSVRRWI
ncbi:MAG: isoprenylcysteine carboxylmethyltransferase family protein [Acidobacteria bacterium]|nr:isoprenylcysteine carboxylmethyltransferase family protein [Acidobacteriota bacterium]